jgi:chitin synthase
MAEAHSQNVGFTKHLVAQTCQLIAAILHLGNLKFTVDWGRDVNAAVVYNQDVLALVTKLLSITPSALETASVLSYKTKLVKKELCTVFLDPDGAADNRDDLARTLYVMNYVCHPSRDRGIARDLSPSYVARDRGNTRDQA